VPLAPLAALSHTDPTHQIAHALAVQAADGYRAIVAASTRNALDGTTHDKGDYVTPCPF